MIQEDDLLAAVRGSSAYDQVIDWKEKLKMVRDSTTHVCWADAKFKKIDYREINSSLRASKAVNA